METKSIQYNPLGNLTPEEVIVSYVWCAKTLCLKNSICKKTSKFYCIKGRKGTGKTTLLHNLSYHLFDSKYISFKIKDVFKPSLIEEQILIIDRVYNLSFVQRLKLWNSNKIIIYSAHYDTYGVEQINAGLKNTIKLGPKKPEELKEIIRKKLFVANLNLEDFGSVFSDENIKKICKKYSGNPRNVINELYFKI